MVLKPELEMNTYNIIIWLSTNTVYNQIIYCTSEKTGPTNFQQRYFQISPKDTLTKQTVNYVDIESCDLQISVITIFVEAK